ALRRRRPPDAGERGAGVPRGDPAPLSVPRSPPGGDAPQRRPALARRREPPASHDRTRLPRDPDADPHLELARGGARLSRAEPAPSGEVLRAAAGPPAVQAAPHGRGLRPLLPDRALLPRRGRARGPVAGRVL